jgi:hypothetical protein
MAGVLLNLGSTRWNGGKHVLVPEREGQAALCSLLASLEDGSKPEEKFFAFQR